MDVAEDWGRDLLTGTDNLDLVLSQPFRVAALPIFYDRPDAWSYLPKLADLDLSQFDLVLFSDPEYHDLDQVRSWIPVKHHALATGGIFGNRPLDDQNEVYRPYYIRDFLEQNTYQDSSEESKPYRFEALLGARRPHRDFVWKAMHRSGMLAHNIVTYRSGFPGAIHDHVTEAVSDRLGSFLQWPYVSTNLKPEWEVADTVTNRDSRQSPVSIYRRTWYSILCETLFTGPDFFLSEKTIKAMFNRRIFVLFGPPRYLARLREHGFETFRHSIDESYDEETRDLVRYEKAMHQVWQLSWLEDPALLHQGAQPTLDKNQQRLYELEQKRCRDLRDMLIAKIPGRHWNWPPLQVA